MKKVLLLRQFLWLYVRAWWWTHVPAGPRFGRALTGWLLLAAACGLSLAFGAEIWPHTPAAGTGAALGLALAAGVSLALVGRGLWRWARELVQHSHGLSRLVLLGLLLAGAGAALAGLGLLAGGGALLVLTSHPVWLSNWRR